MNTTTDIMKYCDIALPTVFKRVKLLKIKGFTGKFDSKAGVGRPRICFTDTQMEEIKNYQRPSKYDKFSTYEEIGAIIGITAQDTKAYVRMIHMKGASVGRKGLRRTRFTRAQVKRIVNGWDGKRITKYKDQCTYASSNNSVPSKNREDGYYMTIQPYERLNGFNAVAHTK